MIDNLKHRFLVISYNQDNKNVSYSFTKNAPDSYVGLNEISKMAQNAIVISEDWAFFQHDGVDFNQLQIVIEEGIAKGEIKRGASTISQQLVKNIFLTSERTFTRKLKEILITYILEKELRKNKILELYLNAIEFGEGVYGIKQASWFYFKKRPIDLSAREGAFLAMLLPSPKRYGQSFRDKKLTEFAENTISSILLKMKMAKKLSEDEYLAAHAEILSFVEVEIKKELSQEETEDISTEVLEELNHGEDLESFGENYLEDSE